MLYVISGKDREKSRARFRVLREELLKKSGDERVVLENELSENLVTSFVEAQGLFSTISLFVFDSVFDRKEAQEILTVCAKDLVSSPNNFLIFEPQLDKESIGTLKESGAKLENFELPKIDTRPDFNIFSLGDALGARNKKELWVLYQEALTNNLSLEEISGTLFWEVKNLALMKNSKGGDAGLNPFVAKKNRTYAKNYSEDEIKKLSNALVTAYHEAHRGGEPMDIALERFILNL